MLPAFRIARVPVVVVFLAMASSGVADAKKAPRCSGGRFLIDGAAVIAGASTPRHQPVVIDGGLASIGEACPPTPVKLRATRSGTRVTATWTHCAGMAGKVKLTAVIASDCSRLSGKVRSKKDRLKQSFRSRRTRCGDDVVDADNGEQCDGAGTPCGSGGTCDDACGCVTTTTLPATTSTAVVTTTTSSTTTTTSPYSVARQWDEELLDAIRHDTPRPTVHARNLFHVSAAMWDAWAAYDATASQYFVNERHTAPDIETARNVAASYAAYRIIRARYAHIPATPPGFPPYDMAAAVDARMASLGLDVGFTATDGDSPAALGNRIAAAVLAYGATDGANEGPTHTYADDTGFVSSNAPLIVKLPMCIPLPPNNLIGNCMTEPSRWQPLALDFSVSQNGIPEPGGPQKYIGPHWGNVTPFALARSAPGVPYADLPPAPQLGDPEFRDGALEVARFDSYLDPTDPTMIDISPGARGNNSLGADDGTGHALNPATSAPYPSQVVKRGDWGRVLAEFWADGPHSETPPGHWNVLANEVTDTLAPGQKRLGGTGPVMSTLEWDVKLYLALNGAVHDAAILCWETKRVNDSARPISMIRYMASRGQSTDPDLPSYDPDGLPLEPGFIEMITGESSAPGERHEALAAFKHICKDGSGPDSRAGEACTSDDTSPTTGCPGAICPGCCKGELAIRAWPGQPAVPLTQFSGVRWVRAKSWSTYQASTFVTPAFPGYTSGHSTFSRSAAEVLTAFTGSPYFPGGMGHFLARANSYLRFERGPSTDIDLQWATYYDAADDAGLSRRWGGIHPYVDDYGGRITGSKVGKDAFALAMKYFDGEISTPP